MSAGPAASTTPRGNSPSLPACLPGSPLLHSSTWQLNAEPGQRHATRQGCTPQQGAQPGCQARIRWAVLAVKRGGRNRAQGCTAGAQPLAVADGRLHSSAPARHTHLTHTEEPAQGLQQEGGLYDGDVQLPAAELRGFTPKPVLPQKQREAKDASRGERQILPHRQSGRAWASDCCGQAAVAAPPPLGWPASAHGRRRPGHPTWARWRRAQTSSSTRPLLTGLPTPLMERWPVLPCMATHG